MKLIHISDLHIGKRVNEYSMIEDQKYILAEILRIVDEEKPQAVLIAGDVYDKSVPSAEAVEVLDDFIVALSKKDAQIFIISGNHDSAERLAFGNRIMDNYGIHISPVYGGKVKPVCLEDEYGKVNVYMLPFVKPTSVRRYFEEETIESYTDAIRVAIKEMKIDTKERNVLVAHQFVTGALRSDSEEVSVGGMDNVDAQVMEDFDYVALGHIHRPQNISSEKIRYCGTPLKYSFSEASQSKSVSVVELGTKGELKLREVTLEPLRDMVEIKGAFEEISDKAYLEGTTLMNDYVHITLTDEDYIPDVMGKLRPLYHNIMRMDYDNARTRHMQTIGEGADGQDKTPMELFEELYEKQNGMKMSQRQEEIVAGLMEKIWEN